MDPFKEDKFLPTEDGLGKLSNNANLIAIFERSLKLTTNKLLQKENPETIRPIARTRREAMKFRKSKKRQFFLRWGSHPYEIDNFPQCSGVRIQAHTCVSRCERKRPLARVWRADKQVPKRFTLGPF